MVSFHSYQAHHSSHGNSVKSLFQLPRMFNVIGQAAYVQVRTIVVVPKDVDLRALGLECEKVGFQGVEKDR
jgi:hypothetical protein